MLVGAMTKGEAFWPHPLSLRLLVRCFYSWLFALGPLTRPAWWEITAVPEINLQIDRLVAQLSSPVTAPRLTVTDFMDMCGGI